MLLGNNHMAALMPFPNLLLINTTVRVSVLFLLFQSDKIQTFVIFHVLEKNDVPPGGRQKSTRRCLS
jgi:hypothetical protein